MTPHDLIAAFDDMADGPDGVKRLRELVLQLAVRGKLVHQDPADEPAVKLLDRIAKVKSQQVKEGKVRANKLELHVNLANVPFEIPDGWIWTRAAAIGWVNPRNQVADNADVGFVPMPLMPIDYRASVQWETRRWSEVKTGFTHFATGDVAVAKITPCFQNRKSCVMQDLPNGYGAGTTELQILRLLPGTLEARYMLAFFKTPDFISGGVATMSGTAGQQRVSNDYFANRPVPLPPLAEQHRIVAKVDELMAFLDKLEAAKNARDATRTALRDAALAGLRDADGHDDVEVAWGRIAGQMDDLFAEPGDVGPLRQAVLQLAVRGRLVRQDPGDEPAGKLLRRLAAHKAKVGRATRAFTGTAIEATPADVAVPASWAHCALDDIIDPLRPISYGVLVPGAHESEGIPLVRVAELHPRHPVFQPEKSILASVAADYLRIRLQGDELLLGVVGSIGKVGVAHPNWAGAVIARAVARIAVADGMLRDFVLLVLQAPVTQAFFHGSTRTLAQPTLNVSLIRQLPVSIPPLAEQHRIVAKVDELMDLLDKLEARLREAKGLQGAFAAAAVHHLDVDVAADLLTASPANDGVDFQQRQPIVFV